MCIFKLSLSDKAGGDENSYRAIAEPQPVWELFKCGTGVFWRKKQWDSMDGTEHWVRERAKSKEDFQVSIKEVRWDLFQGKKIWK